MAVATQPDWRQIAMEKYPGYPIVGNGPFIAFDKRTGNLILSSFPMELSEYGKIGRLQLPPPPRVFRRIKMMDDE
jgi:hypothetical protein